MNLSEIFARNVKSRLTAVNLTKTDLANMTNVSRNTITNLTSGKSKMARFESIDEIAKALKCEPQQLFDENTNWTIYKWANKYQRGRNND
ncbi:XRE family transcriptional regulator [Limosilactobacillus reuteri]|uniref:XRE family transcriptional regulator n=1 Tax=Limosilactobacillus reuteri TaxID=1598 RepID=A0A855XBV2_LIMRT|nr:helix-turn-helix transcriptional regulator [Limosilactobacillus reuteri]PWT33887.1 XRE family transcriptional regulator [Limosilactobacillus reuteri]PWT39897.1 XRE family transcriptional regulator [Limosilactobacillus reuteri]PWT45352.1 XRE family transcriptional regulator [Limosilactobacillus reuteri]PWT60055.1 XRE family transcriptional regulator [Limosilactobacillus reuteri]PWT68125.1 XRE family transcriptional regulator [Limosilactobacillus reuteri]